MDTISIHAPIVGCDIAVSRIKMGRNSISIHAPIVGCDKRLKGVSVKSTIFQSTHPSWGATGHECSDGIR